MTEIQPDYDRRKHRLQVTLETRQFEIDLLWRRALFFWGFIVSAFGAFAWTYDKHPRLAIAVSCFGLVCSCVWTFANRGSRFVFLNWEAKVERLGTTSSVLYSRRSFRYLRAVDGKGSATRSVASPSP